MVQGTVIRCSASEVLRLVNNKKLTLPASSSRNSMWVPRQLLVPSQAVHVPLKKRMGHGLSMCPEDKPPEKPNVFCP